MMFILVFTKEDKHKAISKGMEFMCEQHIGDDIVYLFKNNNNVNFEDTGIKFIKTNNINF